MHDDALQNRVFIRASHDHMNMMYDVLTLTSTYLMSREVLSKSLSTIKSACLEVEGAKPAWHALAVTLQSFS